MEVQKSLAMAVWVGMVETTVPRLLAMLSILAVFLPSFFMEGSAAALFIPLSLAVGFSMVMSYLLSSTLVPVLAVWLLRHHGHRKDADTGGYFFSLYSRGLEKLMAFRWPLFIAYLVGSALIIWLGGRQLGTEIFPQVDSGQFQLRVRGPTGPRIERTEELAGTIEQARCRVRVAANPGIVTRRGDRASPAKRACAGPIPGSHRAA